DAHPVRAREPDSSIRGLRDGRNVAASAWPEPDAVGAVEDRDLDRPFRLLGLVGGVCPCLQLGPRHAHQATDHVQPERTGVVLDSPEHAGARQSVLAAERGDAAVLQSAESAIGAGPERALRIESKPVDAASAESIGGLVGFMNLAIDEMDDATLSEADPYATARRGIGAERAHRVLTPQHRRGNLLDLTSERHTEQTRIHVGDPEVPAGVLGDGVHVSGGKSPGRDETVAVEGADPHTRRHPDPAAVVSKEGVRNLAVELPIALGVSGAGHAHLSVRPPVQPPTRAHPDGPMLVGEDGVDPWARQALMLRV